MSGTPPVGSEAWRKAVQVKMAQPGRAEAEARAAIKELGQKLRRDLARAEHAKTAQALMAWAYEGDGDHIRAILAVVPAEQVREISAAAALLVSTADDVLTGGSTDG